MSAVESGGNELLVKGRCRLVPAIRPSETFLKRPAVSSPAFRESDVDVPIGCGNRHLRRRVRIASLIRAVTLDPA